jgi:hypothetical protein
MKSEKDIDNLIQEYELLLLKYINEYNGLNQIDMQGNRGSYLLKLITELNSKIDVLKKIL